MTSDTRPVIGIIEGGGTGPELAKVFQRVVSSIYNKETGKKVEFLSFEKLFGYNPKTFWELKKHYYTKPYSFVKKICDKDVKNTLKYYDMLLSKNGLGLFRTAINAETLYRIRGETKTIKVVPLKFKKNGKVIEILFVRDQIQGYYTTEKIKARKNVVEISSKFSKKSFELILDLVQLKARELNFKDSPILFLYKFHIMGIELQKMIDGAAKKTQLKNEYLVMQPDSGAHYLLRDIYSKNVQKVIVVCGNEIGDFLLEALIHYYDLGTKETFFTSNFISSKEGVEELQTMHGSVDDIAGKGIVNPIATLKISAHALEKWLKVPNAIIKMEKIINESTQTKNVTKDFGGDKGTDKVVDYILDSWDEK